MKNEENNYIVYWYHLEGMDIYTEGYKGFTREPKIRHRDHMNPRIKTESVFASAVRKYGKKNMIRTILATGLTRDEAKKLERKWLPYENIGWNVAKGGGGGSTKKLSQESCDKIRKIQEILHKDSLVRKIVGHNARRKNLSNDDNNLYNRTIYQLSNPNCNHRGSQKNSLPQLISNKTKKKFNKKELRLYDRLKYKLQKMGIKPDQYNQELINQLIKEDKINNL